MSALGRQADQAIGSDLQQVLLPSNAIPVGTWRVTNPPPANAKVGAMAADAIQYGAGKYLQLVIDVTVVGGAGTVQVAIRGWDPASGKAYLILQSAVLAAVATTVLRVGPALTVAANLVANDFVPLMWGVDFVVAGNAVTLSLGAQQMP